MSAVPFALLLLWGGILLLWGAAFGARVRAEAQISNFHNYSGVFLYMVAAPSVLSQACFTWRLAFLKRGVGHEALIYVLRCRRAGYLLGVRAMVMLTWA